MFSYLASNRLLCSFQVGFEVASGLRNELLGEAANALKETSAAASQDTEDILAEAKPFDFGASIQSFRPQSSSQELLSDSQVSFT